MNSVLMTLYAETSLHPGTGQTTGVVDLPIQRERHTGFPKIEGSGVKGALRSLAKTTLRSGTGPALSAEEIAAVFGPDTANASDHAGALMVTDARILAFPVRSLTDVFVWITCPQAIERLRRDALLAEVSLDLPAPPAPTPGPDQAFAVAGGALAAGARLVLEDLDFSVVLQEAERHPASTLHTLTRVNRIQSHLVVLADSIFGYFVQYATQVAARIVLTPEKTAGNLWYEETLPPDTVLYSLLMATNPRDQNQKKPSGIPDAAGVIQKTRALFPAAGAYMQVGGNETVGQGWCAVRLTPEA